MKKARAQVRKRPRAKAKTPKPSARTPKGKAAKKTKSNPQPPRGGAPKSAKSVAPNVQLLPDGETFQLIHGSTIFHANADELDALIGAMARIRAQMSPAVPRSFPQGTKLHQHDATNYMVGLDEASGLPTLAIRSASFGWLKYDFDPRSAMEVSLHLQEAAKKTGR